MAVGPTTVVLDCRWHSIGGPGRTTELLLRGLAVDPPPGRWVLWGPAAIEGLAWPGAEIVPISVDPRRWLGQRSAYDIPAGQLTLFMHQQRPLRSVPAITTVYDTIALRHGSNRPVRELKRQFLKRIAAGSVQILTISEHSKASIIGDLGVAPGRIEILRFPFDDAFVDRVQLLRRSLDRSNVALYVGGFLPHKNLPRLLQAFDRSRFSQAGGRLVLAGGTGRQARELLDQLTPRQRQSVTVRPSCSQAELDVLFATSLLLVQPSLEEGFGLPAWEALCSSLPVCASDGGALPEVVGEFVQPFPARSVAAMAEAIDDCAERAQSQDGSAGRISQALRRDAPTVRQFAHQVRASVERQLARPRRH